MAAPNLKPLSLLLLLFASACASSDVPHESRATAPDAAAHPAPVAPAPALAEPADELAELEASLDAYERQLADNEARLRAMGVLVAVRDDKFGDATSAGRFAPPPPAVAKTTPTARETEDRAATRPADTSSKEPAKDKKRPSRPAGGVGKAATSASSPAPRPAPRGDLAGDSPMRAESKADEDLGRGRCAELCELADSTCDLEAKICDLAARHQGDARYAEVCRRADEDCRIAAEACTVCSP